MTGVGKMDDWGMMGVGCRPLHRVKGGEAWGVSRVIAIITWKIELAMPMRVFNPESTPVVNI